MKLLNVVALLRDWPDKKLLKGQVGTIVEQLDENVFDVEFVDSRTGKSIAIESFKSDELFLLHFEHEAV